MAQRQPDRTVSRRSEHIQGAVPFRMMFGFRMHSGYAERRLEPGVLDLTFGDPHELQMPEYVEALRDIGRSARRAVVRLQAERAAGPGRRRRLARARRPARLDR